MRDRLPAVVLAAALLVILGYVAAAGLRARGITGLFPAVVGVIGGLAALANLIGVLRGRDPQPVEASPEGASGAWLAGLSFGVPVIYAVLLWLLGFWVASGVTLLLLPPLLGYRRPLVVVAVALGTLFAIEAVFVQVFDMTLPRGMVFERLLDSDED